MSRKIIVTCGAAETITSLPVRCGEAGRPDQPPNDYQPILMPLPRHTVEHTGYGIVSAYVAPGVPRPRAGKRQGQRNTYSQAVKKGRVHLHEEGTWHE